MPPQTHYAKSGEVNIAYQVVGEGPLELVFIPGFVSHLEVIWEIPPLSRLFERLASFARLILWDKREQGLSDRFGHVPTLEQGMDDLRAVMDAAGSERAALFGVSEGGPMSLLFAATHPERTQALVLYGTYARQMRAPDYPIGLPDSAHAQFAAMIERDWGSAAVLEVFAPSMADDPAFRQWWAHLLRAGTSPRGARNLVELYREIDVRHILPAISAPTLVLHRAGDRAVLAASGRYMADHIPGASYVELPGEDHVYFVGDTDALLDEVEEFLTGELHEREPDRVLATVLFCDIVGSTEQAAELGDRRWRDMLAEHEALVDRALARHRGHKIKTMGDGVLATFDGPARAIRCACALRDDVRRLGVRVRAGLHTGECEVMGEDIGGLAVHIGARVGASAEPDEVLVSRTVTDLVAGSGICFEDRGTHTLKGVPGDWQLYSVAT